MRKHRSIKVLTNDAIHNNSIKSQYQLYKNYKLGDFVEQDLEQEAYFFKKVKNNLQKSRLRLKSIKLINFRGFSNLEVDLSSEYVVLAANNGYGKTGVLESIFNGLTWLMRNFKANSANGNFIRPEDIRADKKVDSASVLLEVNLLQGDKENSRYSINLSKTNDDAEEKQDGSYQEFRSLAEMYKELALYEVNFPVLAFYSVERGNAIRRGELKKSADELLKEFNSKDYFLNVSHAPRFEVFLAWMVSVNTQELYEYNTNPAAILREKALTTVKALKELQSSDVKVSEIIKQLESEVNRINALQNSSKSTESTGSNNKNKIIFDAIYKFMPEIKNLKFEFNGDTSKVDLICEKNNCVISVSQLSQGEKTMLSLVCDISLRLISANKNRDNPFDGDGIIIIDEIDLHLHPIWQQTVLLRLRETFPNIQFIISTHSSNVLSTSSNDCIRKIAESKIGISGHYDIEVPDFSLGAETSTLQEDIQGVSSRPESLEIIQKLFLYKEMVIDDKWDTPQAEKLFNELCEWGEGHDAIINKLRLDVTLRKRRRDKK